MKQLYIFAFLYILLLKWVFVFAIIPIFRHIKRAQNCTFWTLSYNLLDSTRDVLESILHLELQLLAPVHRL